VLIVMIPVFHGDPLSESRLRREAVRRIGAALYSVPSGQGNAA
jgi:hypothetical protein